MQLNMKETIGCVVSLSNLKDEENYILLLINSIIKTSLFCKQMCCNYQYHLHFEQTFHRLTNNNKTTSSKPDTHIQD